MSTEVQQDQLAATYLPFEAAGLKFHNPCVVGSGPTVKTEGMIRQIDEAGWGAACLKLSFDPEPYISREPRYKWWKKEKLHSFTAEKRITVDEALRLADFARKNTKTTKWFSNITYCGDKGIDGWVNMAKRFEGAGIHGNELNMCCPNMSFNKQATDHYVNQRTGASMCECTDTVADIVREVRKGTKVPLCVKISPEWGNLGALSVACFEAGADFVASVGNRLGVPPIDIENPEQGPYDLQKEPSISCLSGPWLKPLALKDTYAISSAVAANKLEEKLKRRCYIVGYGGMATWQDYVQMNLMGADMIGVCTETMLRGYAYLAQELTRMKKWMAEKEEKGNG